MEEDTGMKEENTETMPNCCGCDSRIASRTANIVMLLVSSIYIIYDLIRIHDTDPNTAPEDDELLYLKIMMSVSAIQIIVNALAIWGTNTYRDWPVMVSLGWISIYMIILTLISIFSAIFGAGGLSVLIEGTIIVLIQFSFMFWPMYEYIQEYEKLKDLAVAHEVELDAKKNLESV